MRAGPIEGDPDDCSLRYANFTERGRASLLSGRQTCERPLGLTGRWGVSAVFRPDNAIVDRLGELAAEIGAELDAVHWIHGPESWHATLRALESYRPEIPPGDVALRAYCKALDKATVGVPPLKVEVRGLSPHEGGLLLFVRPLDRTLTTLQAAFSDTLSAENVGWFEARTRDIWNIGLVHFTVPLADPRRFVAWCDERRDLRLATTTFDAVEIVRALPAARDVRLETLHRTELGTS